VGRQVARSDCAPVAPAHIAVLPFEPRHGNIARQRHASSRSTRSTHDAVLYILPITSTLTYGLWSRSDQLIWRRRLRVSRRRSVQRSTGMDAWMAVSESRVIKEQSGKLVNASAPPRGERPSSTDPARDTDPTLQRFPVQSGRCSAHLASRERLRAQYLFKRLAAWRPGRPPGPEPGPEGTPEGLPHNELIAFGGSPGAHRHRQECSADTGGHTSPAQKM
jgi:hypothetical protein